MSKNLGADTFPDPMGHFGTTWGPFWIFDVLIEGGDQKTYLPKVDYNGQQPSGRHLSRPHGPFWGPLAALLDSTGCDIAGIERVPQA